MIYWSNRFRIKNGLDVQGANVQIIDNGSGNARMEIGGTLSIRPEGTTSNKHFFELNDYTAAGNVGAATMSTTGNITVGGNLTLNSNSNGLITRQILACVSYMTTVHLWHMAIAVMI